MPDYLQLAPTMPDPIGGLESREVPSEFRMFRVGENETTKGTFVFDAEAAELVMSNYAKRGIDMLMDYEHQSLADPPVEAPAAATRMVPQIRNGELWATGVKWTDRAASYLLAGEYRYFSPAFEYDTKTGRVTKLINVALTNNPATHGIQPLVAASATRKEEPRMDFEKLYNELKAQLDAQATELASLRAFKSEHEKDVAVTGEEIGQLTAVAGLRADAKQSDRLAAVTQMATLRSNLVALTGAKTDAEAIGTVAGWKHNAASVAELSTKLAQLEGEKLEGAVKALLDEADAQGKVEPARREEFRQIALRSGGGKLNADGVETLRVCLSAIAPKVTTAGRAQPATVGAALHPQQIEIAERCGRDPAELLKAGAART
jgi:phage I-like protein